MSASLAAKLTTMSPDTRTEFDSPDGRGGVVKVRYYEEPARGDNGHLVPGATTGEFVVTWPSGRSSMYHVGPMPESKPYMAQRAAADITDHFFRAKLGLKPRSHF